MNTKTITLKPAAFGTVSHGTLRTEDLLAAFISELESQVLVNGEYFSRPENRAARDRFANLIGEAQDCCADEDGKIHDDKLEQADELVNETLPDALSKFAPVYGYFGAHCGDGSDFGFWPQDINEIKEQVGFVSSKEQEYPGDGFEGEWLHVNERGNCTLYCREDFGVNAAGDRDFKDVEIWGIV